MPLDTYTARFALPELIEREAVNVLGCKVYRDGALVAPSAGTVTVYDAARVAVVDAASVTIASSAASYTWTPSASLQLGEGWRVVWRLTIGGVVYSFENDAALVRRTLWCPVADVDLYRMEPALDPSGQAPLTGETDYQTYIDEAWTQTQARLLQVGNRPNLICQPSALRQYVQYLTLALIYGALAGRQGSAAYLDKDKSYRTLASEEWSRMNFTYASGDTTTPAVRRSAAPSVWLMGRGFDRHTTRGNRGSW